MILAENVIVFTNTYPFLNYNTNNLRKEPTILKIKNICNLFCRRPFCNEKVGQQICPSIKIPWYTYYRASDLGVQKGRLMHMMVRRFQWRGNQSAAALKSGGNFWFTVTRRRVITLEGIFLLRWPLLNAMLWLADGVSKQWTATPLKAEWRFRHNTAYRWRWGAENRRTRWKRYDLMIVVGAGPSGLSAIDITKKGLVVVFDEWKAWRTAV